MDSPLNNLPGREPTAAEIEYASLREESLRRVEGRQQTLSIAMTLAGAFLGIGWGSGSVALLIYPPLAMLLAASWAQNEIRIGHINGYIRDHIESTIPGLGYERYRRQREMQDRFGSWPIEIIAIGGIFLLTQIMAIVLSLFHFTGSLVEWLLMIVSIGAVGVLLYMLDYVRRRATM